MRILFSALKLVSQLQLTLSINSNDVNDNIVDDFKNIEN